MPTFDYQRKTLDTYNVTKYTHKYKHRDHNLSVNCVLNFSFVSSMKLIISIGLGESLS